MEYDKLSDQMKEKLRHLEGSSSTLENDIFDALEDAENEEDFIISAIAKFEDVKDECNRWIENLRGSYEMQEL